MSKHTVEGLWSNEASKAQKTAEGDTLMSIETPSAIFTPHYVDVLWHSRLPVFPVPPKVQEFIRNLKDLGILGFRRNQMELETVSFEINVPYLRRAMNDVFRRILRLRFFTVEVNTGIEDTDDAINTAVGNIVPVVTDMCMTALYAKLCNINKTYGQHAARYTTAASYSDDIELPLPFAMAIEEFGVFETRCMRKNYIPLPTYPDGTLHEGRANAVYPSVEYMSYLPTLKKLGIQTKSINPCDKSGSAWWTYKVKNVYNCTDLHAVLPPSNYSALSPVLRSIFCYAERDNVCGDIIRFPTDRVDYGSLMNEITPGFAARSFCALIDGPEEEWSFGAV